jgi:hypothetical protein
MAHLNAPNFKNAHAGRFCPREIKNFGGKGVLTGGRLDLKSQI